MDAEIVVLGPAWFCRRMHVFPTVPNIVMILVALHWVAMQVCVADRFILQH